MPIEIQKSYYKTGVNNIRKFFLQKRELQKKKSVFFRMGFVINLEEKSSPKKLQSVKIISKVGHFLF